MAELEQDDILTVDEIDSESPEMVDEIEFDSLDLQVANLASTIEHQRELAFSPLVAEEAKSQALSLPDIMSTHSKRLGLTSKQFARAAANQGLDLGVIVTRLGNQGLSREDVFKKLEDKGTVAFKPLEERKEGMKKIRRQRLIAVRGADINLLGQKRTASYEKEFDYTKDELRKAYQTDYKKSRDPSTRQSSVAQIVYEMGSDAGFSNDQMAAILANGFAESLLDPEAENPSREDSHGVWQFNRGAGEGVGHTVEQLQDPRFQMGRIIEAVNTRDELEGFRNPEADVNELTTQFMANFEKPKVQDEEETKRRQAYLKQANRLLKEAKKPKEKGILEKDRQTRQKVLDRLQGKDKKDWVLKSDDEAVGGDVQNEIAQPGSAAHKRFEGEVADLTVAEGSSDPERARMMAEKLAEYSEDGADNIRETFAESAFMALWQVGVDYDQAKVAEEIGISHNEFQARANIEGSREYKIAGEIATRNRRHVGLYLTTGKLGVPAFVSYEFMDPKNRMGEWRPGKGDAYLSRLWHAFSRNRVQFVGYSEGDVPVFRAQGHLMSMFDKLNFHLSMSSGALERLLDGPEGESIIEALEEGSISGAKKAQDFTKTLLSTDAARENGWVALGLGGLGFLIDVFTPDPTFGLAMVASRTGRGVKKIAPLINKRHLPVALDKMGSAAVDMTETQVLITRAKEQFASGNYEEGRKFLDQAKKTATQAESAERDVRKVLSNVMDEVDRTDANVALEISRDVPILTGRDAGKLDETLAFSDFGLRRDYVHPSVERVVSRGESGSQIVRYSEFFDVSKKIDRLKDLSVKIERGETADVFIAGVQRGAMDDLVGKVTDQLTNRGFSRARGKGQSDEVTESIREMIDFLRSADGSTLLAKNPAEFEARLAQYVDGLPVKTSKRGPGFRRTIMEDLRVNITKAHREARKVASSAEVATSAADLKQELVDVTRSLAAIAESRGAGHGFVRAALAKQEKINVEPVITAVMNRYDEIGTDKISPLALAFRNELEMAFPAMRGDAALHVARNLDDRLKAIHRQTGESIDLIYETREFKDIIPDLKRKMGAAAVDPLKAVDDVAAAVVEDVPGIIMDPKFIKIDLGEELLTSKEIQEFTRDLSARLEAQDMTDFTAELAMKTVKQLKQIAKANGVKKYSKLRKSSLIEEITQREKVRKFLPEEYLRKNPDAAAQYDATKQKVIDAQKEFEKAIDELGALEAANAPTIRKLQDQPSAAIEAAMDASPDVSVIDIGGQKFRLFSRDLAEAKLREAEFIRDQRIAEVENFRRVVAGRAEDTLSLAEDIDFIPGLVVKIEGGKLQVKSIGLPSELQNKGIATTLYKVAMQRAKKEGLDFASDVNPSPDAQRIYERLIDERFPLKKVISREAAPEAMEARRTADSLIDELRQFHEIPFNNFTVGEVDGSPRLLWDWNRLDEYLDYFSPTGESPSAPAYDLLMDIRSRAYALDESPEWIAKFAAEPIETVRYIADKADLARLSDDVLSAGVGKKAVRPATELTDLVEDTQKVVRAMEEAPTVEAFILEISKVARRELSSEQMGAVTKWLAKSGIKVNHKGAVFVAEDPAVIVQAEEAFAKAFADYAKGRPPPTPDTTSAFERIRDRLVGSFASAKNAKSEGAKFTPSSEIEQVFDDLLRGAKPLRPGAPNIFNALKRTLLDDLPNKVGDEYLLRISQESDRLGHPISVQELKKLVSEAAVKQAKNPDIEVTIDLPGPVSLGGLLSVKPKSSYSLMEFGQGSYNFAERKNLLDSSAVKKIALENRLSAVKELTPTQMIDQYVTTSRPVARIARSMYLGGDPDALYDMRHLPPKIRAAIKAGVRVVQQSIGDSVTLISEGAASSGKLIRFMTGDPQVKFKSGRNVLSAGHDMMGSATESLKTYISLFSDPTIPGNTANIGHIRVLLDTFKKPIGKKGSYSPGEAEKIEKAFNALVYNESGSTLLKDIFEGTGHAKGKGIRSEHLKILSSIFDITGNSSHKVGSSADQFRKLYLDIDTLYPARKYGDAPVANRVAVLIAGHGQATKARLEWVGLGIAVDAKTATDFKRWIMGESLDDVADLQKVRQAFRTQGYDPNFMQAADLEGLNFFVPKAARQKLSLALKQATDPELKAFSGDMLESIGKGIREGATSSQLAMAWTARYLKTRMVRGHFLLKGRYFWMNTMDHFNQMSQIVGFRPAFISTMRILPQTWANNPVGQAVLFAAQKAGKDQAGEAFRMVMQKAGDKGADWAATLTRASKWRGDVNALLDGRPGFLVVDGIPHAYTDLRRIGVEEGMSASFDTAELGTKIRAAGTMFLEKSAERRGLMRIPGAPSTREWVKLAEDMAEGWSERERYGAMMTLVEMGVGPRKAARLVIDGLYDYAGSMSKADRHFLVTIVFPFWAFQKNANRQLIDVIFSPRGAYRLGVLNRAYTKGADLASELLYEGIVDPLGINADGMDDTQREAYESLKAALSRDLGGIPLSRLPAPYKRQLRMALTGRDVIYEDGMIYNIDDFGLKMREDFGKQMRDAYPGLGGELEKRYVEKPSRSSIARYAQNRTSVMVPNVMNEQNKIFYEMMDRQNPNRTFTSYVLPEQSYIASANFVSLVTLSSFALIDKIKNVGPEEWFGGADDGADLFSVRYPINEILQAERSLLVPDLLPLVDLNQDAIPYQVAPILAKKLDEWGIPVLVVNPKEDPLNLKLTYIESMKKLESGEITAQPDDPYLNGATLEPTMRYYIDGGVGALIFKHSIADELNGVLKKWAETPHEAVSGLDGDLRKLARTWGLIDIYEFSPDRTAKGEAWEAEKETGGHDIPGVVAARDAKYIDLEDYPDEKAKQTAEREARKKKIDAARKKENEARLERLKKRGDSDNQDPTKPTKL